MGGAHAARRDDGDAQGRPRQARRDSGAPRRRRPWSRRAAPARSRGERGDALEDAVEAGGEEGLGGDVARFAHDPLVWIEPGRSLLDLFGREWVLVASDEAWRGAVVAVERCVELHLP